MSGNLPPRGPEYSASITEPEWAIVFAGLGEVAAKYSNPVLARLQQQLAPQLARQRLNGASPEPDPPGA